MNYLKDISEFIFICNEPKKADIIFMNDQYEVIHSFIDGKQLF